MVSNKFFAPPSSMFIDFVFLFISIYFIFELRCIKIGFCLIGFTRQNPIKIGFRNRTSCDYLNAPTSYEIALTASTLVLARRRARFASIICLFPSAFLKLASAISRVF